MPCNNFHLVCIHDSIMMILFRNMRACVGSDAKFMDFIYRLSPKFATGFIAKKMAGLLK